NVLECGAGDLNWVVDARSHEVDVLAVCSVEAVALWELGNLVSNNAWLEASVSSDLLQWSGQSLADDANAGCLVAGKLKIVVQDVISLQQRNATACNDALFNSCLSVTDSILNAVLALLELNLGSCAHLKHCNAAGKLSQALV